MVNLFLTFLLFRESLLCYVSQLLTKVFQTNGERFLLEFQSLQSFSKFIRIWFEVNIKSFDRQLTLCSLKAHLYLFHVVSLKESFKKGTWLVMNPFALLQ